MGTTGHGLVYPSSSSPVNPPADIQALADSTETALDVYETWNTWNLSWDTSGGGGFLSVGGSGFSQGHYMQIGKFVHAEFRVELASGFSVDTGTFVLMLPVTAYSFSGAIFHSTIGNWTARDTSTPYHWSGALSLFQSSADRVCFNGSWDGTAPRSRIDSNDPIVWAAGDVLSGNLNYRAA